MVRPEVIRRRLEQLSTYLEILERLARYERSEFLADPEHYGSAERFLQLAVEMTLDMGAHVVAEEDLGSVNQSRDIPELWARHGLIDPPLARNWIRMIGFRNILVHDYLDVDRDIVYDVLTQRLGDIRAVQQAFAQFL